MKQLIVLMVIVGIMSCCFCGAVEYQYPVGILGKRLLIIHQKSSSDIMLCAYDPEKSSSKKLLSEHYTPAAVQVLPGGQAFSFIDNGRVRVKELIKRSPKSLEFYEPIYAISWLRWLDNARAVFMAKERDVFGIYQCNLKGQVQRIVRKEMSDALYPNYCDEKLFYIERAIRSGGRFLVKQVEYPQNIVYDDRVLVNACTAQTIAMFDRAIAFLHGIDGESCYVVGYPHEIDTSYTSIDFDYYQIQKKRTGGWQTKKLFSFAVPTALLLPDSESRLYEHMLPLVPRHIGDAIYFVDIARRQVRDRWFCFRSISHLDIYCFSISTGEITQVTHATKDQFFFSPMEFANKLYCGTRINRPEDLLKLPYFLSFDFR